jgi:hypothetical protein
MSIMCKMNSSCETTSGMCVHEKMMLAVVLLAVAAIAGYLLLA